MFTKVSILLFYLRIFQSRGFKRACHTLIGVVVLVGTTILLCQLLQCLPVQSNWNKNIRNAKCININALTYSYAALNIMQDILILALPLPWIFPLKLELHQKIGVLIMFQIGVFACITAMIRLRFLTQFGGNNSTDPLWENASTALWTALEVNTAVICSCLPAIRALYQTGRQMASSSSSKGRSGTALSGGGGAPGASFRSRSKGSCNTTIEEHRLELAEEWVQKDAEEDRRQEPRSIMDKGASNPPPVDWKKPYYMPDVAEEPDLETQYAEFPQKFLMTPAYRR